MSIFDLRQSVINEYSKCVQSFLSTADDRIRAFIEESLLKNQALWPDAASVLRTGLSDQIGLGVLCR